MPRKGPTTLTPTMAEIGQRIRRLRNARSLSLRDLAQAATLSASFLSQLERGQTNASIASLTAITSALGVSTGYLLSSEDQLLRPNRRIDRHPLTTGSYEEYALTRRPLPVFEVYLGVLHPGAGSYPEPYVHGDSDEFCYVISGTVELHIGDVVHRLEPGDSMEYRTSIPHRTVNPGDDLAEVLYVVGPPSSASKPAADSQPAADRPGAKSMEP